MRKILYLAGTDPRSTSYGGEQRTHFIWEALKKCGEVTTLIAVPRKSMEKEDTASRITWVYLDRRFTLGWFARRCFQRAFPAVELPLPRGIVETGFEFVKGRFDCVVARHHSQVSLFRAWRIAPVILDADDDPLEMFKTAEASQLGKVHRATYEYFLRKWVRRINSKCARGWIANADHAERYPFPTTFVSNIPAQPSVSYSITASPEPYLLTVGYLAHRPNAEGIDWFLTSIWPKLHEDRPELAYQIVGGGLPELYRQKWVAVPGVILRGFVKDLAPCYEKCLACVVPILSGSGSCIKTLEALSFHRPCLATSFGVRGIPQNLVSDANGLLVFQTATEALARLSFAEKQRNSPEIAGPSPILNCFSSGHVYSAIKASLVEGPLK